MSLISLPSGEAHINPDACRPSSRSSRRRRKLAHKLARMPLSYFGIQLQYPW